jgi:hypothetical protein
MRIQTIFTVPERGIGMPDYSSPKPYGQAPIGPIYTLSDLGELAVRLGSIDSFDRRGNVLWFDDFENGLNKWHSTSPHTGKTELRTTTARNGALSLYMETYPSSEATRSITRYLPYPVLSRVGLECSFAALGDLGADTAGNGRVIQEIRFFDGSKCYTFSSYYHGGDRYEIVIVDKDAGDVVLRTKRFFHDGGYTTFDTFKLVADLPNKKYARLLVDDDVFSLGEYQPQEISDSSAPHLEIWILLTTYRNFPAWIYVDDVIVTQNEP